MQEGEWDRKERTKLLGRQGGLRVDQGLVDSPSSRHLPPGPPEPGPIRPAPGAHFLASRALGGSGKPRATALGTQPCAGLDAAQM